jgi:hypothetical protein
MIISKIYHINHVDKIINLHHWLQDHNLSLGILKINIYLLVKLEYPQILELTLNIDNLILMLF